MKTNKIIAGLILAVAYPLMYYSWTLTIKHTWVATILCSFKMTLLTSIQTCFDLSKADIPIETQPNSMRKLWCLKLTK